MNRMAKEKKIPKLPGDALKPLIVTGVEALGRGEDLNKLGLFLQSIAPLGPQAMQEINISDYITRLAGSLGIDTEGLVKSEEQKQVEQQAAMEQQQAMQNQQTLGNIAEKSAPEMMRGLNEGGGQEVPPPEMTN
jgi:hypothetical protein